MPNEYLGTSMFRGVFWFSQPPMLPSPSKFSQARIVPATTTPQRLPIPPRITMQSRNTEMLKSNWVGNAPELNEAMKAPAIPPKKAPIAYDHVFVRISGTPIAPAAVSSSRIAIQARPSRENCKRYEQNTVKSTSTIAVQKKTSVDWIACPRWFALQHCR